MYFSWRSSNARIISYLFGMILVFGSLVYASYLWYGKNYLIVCFYNVAKINEIGESMNPIWYFYVECFLQYINIFIFLFAIYPFVYLIPIIRLTYRQSDYYGKYELLKPWKEDIDIPEWGSDQKPLPHKKARSIDKTPLSEYDWDSHFFCNSYFIIFIVFYFCWTYTVSYDALFILPFCYVCMGYLSKTVLFIVLFFAFLYGVCS